MKLYATLLAVLIAVPALAQTETDPAKNSETSADELSNRTGSIFFSDESMTTMRTGDEIKTQWSTLSVEDQDAIRARCEEMMAAETGTETSTDGTATAQTDTGTTGDMGYMSDAARMGPICEMVSTY